MTEIPYTLTNYKRMVVVDDNFEDAFSVMEIDVNRLSGNVNLPETFEPLRMDKLILMLVKDGFADISLDYISYSLAENSFLMIMPSHIVQLNKITNNFKARLIVVSKSFLDDCHLTGERPHSVTNYLEIRKNPFFQLVVEERLILEKCMDYTCEKIRVENHFLHKEIVENAFMGFLIELANIFHSKRKQLQKAVLSRKEELFEQFLKLLFIHVKKQHGVTFYAGKLFITPQYLSLILKEITGKTANTWIDRALMVEAKLLLKTPKMTIQQVADKLHFSNQSTFGKFFKKHMGISPMEYRKS